jgi:hypothetical protein
MPSASPLLLSVFDILEYLGITLVLVWYLTGDTLVP